MRLLFSAHSMLILYNLTVSIAGIVLSLKGIVSDDVYIEITQYYNPNSYLMYDVTKYYKNSDYTGLLETSEHGPYRLEF